MNSAPAPANPSLITAPATPRSVHHIGIPIRNLERSLEFYQHFCGGNVEFIDPMRGPGLAAGTQVPNAECKFAMLRIGNTILELIEYTQQGEAFHRANNDVGSIHIAFEVEDIHGLFNKLSQAGVPFNAPPYTFTEADGAPHVIGATFAYLRDPDGIQLEIFEAAK